jgi:hypothetical protein
MWGLSASSRTDRFGAGPTAPVADALPVSAKAPTTPAPTTGTARFRRFGFDDRFVCRIDTASHAFRQLLQIFVAHFLFVRPAATPGKAISTTRRRYTEFLNAIVAVDVNGYSESSITTAPTSVSLV